MPKLTTNPQAESFYGVSPYIGMGNNPVLMVDPDGEFVITLTAVLMGAAFGSLSGAIMASEAGLDHREGLWKGALAGAAGGALSQIVTPGVGVLSGAKAGAINSASAAFGSSFTGSLINGENIGDSFINGLKGGAIGGGIGGLFGGLSGGISANKMGLKFWNGKDLSKSSVALIKSTGYDLNSEISPTDVNLIKAREAWIPDAPMEHVKNFTVEKVPESIQSLMDKRSAAAATPPYKLRGVYTGKSSIYFNKKYAFSSAKELFYTMTHEFNHVSQHALLKGTKVSSSILNHVKEYTAYSHGARLGSTNYGGYGPGGYYHHLIPSIVKNQYYSSFQAHNFEWTKTVKFTNLKF